MSIFMESFLCYAFIRWINYYAWYSKKVTIIYLLVDNSMKVIVFTWHIIAVTRIVKIVINWNCTSFDCWNGHNAVACNRILLRLKYCALRQIMLHSKHFWLLRKEVHIYFSFFIDRLDVSFPSFFYYNLRIELS